MKDITHRQQEMLDAIRSLTDARGIPPTRRELGRALGIKNVNGVTDHLRALQRKGYVRIDNMTARAIYLVGSGNDGVGSACSDVSVPREIEALERQRVVGLAIAKRLAEITDGNTEQGRLVVELVRALRQSEAA